MADAPDDLWHRADRLFEAALDLPQAARAAFVAEASGGDDELRRQVERLLDAVDDGDELAPGGAMQGPLFDAFAEELEAEEGENDGQVVGDYRILRELGRGGTAIVYLAEPLEAEAGPACRDPACRDPACRGLVALKLLRLGHTTDEVLRRFDRERRILARLQHPHIARLEGGGVDRDGRPYLAMEYVEGRPVDRYCDRERLGVMARLALFVRVARALEYAHRSRVIHRDLKPSNILVTAAGTPKLLDFGIAKLLDADARTDYLTRTLMRRLTPAYASPEQIRGEPPTAATDVYQLGVLLYALLTGRWPYPLSRSTVGQVVLAVSEGEAVPPSAAVDGGGAADPTVKGEPASLEDLAADRGTSREELRQQLEGETDRIVLKALRREPGERYPSVKLLATEVQAVVSLREQAPGAAESS